MTDPLEGKNSFSNRQSTGFNVSLWILSMQPQPDSHFQRLTGLQHTSFSENLSSCIIYFFAWDGNQSVEVLSRRHSSFYRVR